MQNRGPGAGARLGLSVDDIRSSAPENLSSGSPFSANFVMTQLFSIRPINDSTHGSRRGRLQRSRSRKGLATSAAGAPAGHSTGSGPPPSTSADCSRRLTRCPCCGTECAFRTGPPLQHSVSTATLAGHFLPRLPHRRRNARCRTDHGGRAVDPCYRPAAPLRTRLDLSQAEPIGELLAVATPIGRVVNWSSPRNKTWCIPQHGPRHHSAPRCDSQGSVAAQSTRPLSIDLDVVGPDSPLTARTWSAATSLKASHCIAPVDWDRQVRNMFDRPIRWSRAEPSRGITGRPPWAQAAEV